MPLEVLAGGAAGPARAIAEALGKGAWVLDLGQSAAKLAADGHLFRRVRDLSILPLRRPGSKDENMAGERLEIAQQRLALRAMLKELLHEAGALLGGPTVLLLALPSEIAEDLVPQGSSYIGMGLDAALAADLGRLVDAPVQVLNDAELAAWAAALALPSPSFPVLVLTLGFAVGGALIEAPGSSTWTAAFRAMIGGS